MCNDASKSLPNYNYIRIRYCFSSTLQLAVSCFFSRAQVKNPLTQQLGRADQLFAGLSKIFVFAWQAVCFVMAPLPYFLSKCFLT